MKLNSYEEGEGGAAYRRSVYTDLVRLLNQPDHRERRPCPGCSKRCPCSGSQTCTCSCSPDCADAPRVLSSEPDRYPIEDGIISLVFGFYSLRLCPPYWSCEGHLFAGGDVRREPQVWFYSRSLIYPKLISEYIVKLHVAGQLHYPWQVVVSHADDPLETGFSLQPGLVDDGDLVKMQADARVLGAGLVAGMKQIAERYLRQNGEQLLAPEQQQ